MTTKNETVSMGRIVTELETAYGAIRERHPEVPEAYIVVGPDKNGSKLGHWAKESWVEGDEPRHELFISADNLDRPADEVFGTLLHEAAHALATARGIKDCSGQRHNLKFKALAEELGMTVQEQGSRAWAWTTVTKDTLREYQDTVLALSGTIKAYRKRRGNGRTRDGNRAYRRKVSSAKSMMRFLATAEPTAFAELVAELGVTCPECGADVA